MTGESTPTLIRVLRHPVRCSRADPVPLPDALPVVSFEPDELAG